MIGDVYEPLSAYRDEFRAKFARLTREKLKSLIARSGIDVAASRRQAAAVRSLQRQISNNRLWQSLYTLMMALGFVVGAVALIVLCVDDGLGSGASAACALGGIVGIALGVLMFSLRGSVSKQLKGLESEEERERAKAWRQMDALNRLYTWDLTPRLIEATVPRLEFDPFFTAKRLGDLKRIYGWSDSFNAGKSIVFAQSGVINGNPFLFGEYLKQEWSEKTYAGSLVIEWREIEEDSMGRTRVVTKRETLRATVSKPVPVYSKRKLLVYGNDAAPDLSFSRKPSGFDDDGLFDGVRKKFRLHGLRKLSRNLDDDSNFTLMSNHEFETWFNASDRDDEVEFRLLFTALAQTQMMALMKDRDVGYGDDFTFIKNRRLNFLLSKHLSDAVIDTDPERFRDWNIERAVRNFIAFNEKYFKDAYFALAPILAIPLYQQTRPHEEIWKDVIDTDGASFWEHESIANRYGDECFRHPSCITKSILKTEVVNRSDGISDIEVTAYGFRGEDRVDHVRVRGGDGSYHSVPVEWIEYLPVSRTTEMRASESDAPGGDFMERFKKSNASLFRRGIMSYLGR